MLIEFSVTNFRSFRDKATLSMKASAGKENLSNTFESEYGRFLRSAAIYGANAAGKSAIIMAFSAAIRIIRESDGRKINAPIPGYSPYAFTAGKTEPASFEFVFAANGMKYIYGFSYTSDKVTEEYLYCYRTAKPSCIFSRVMEEYSFPSPAIRKELEPLVSVNTEKKLFISTATTWNAKSTRDAYLWLSDSVQAFSSSGIEQLTLSDYLEDNDNALKVFTKQLLNEADIGISDYAMERSLDGDYRIRSSHVIGNEDGHKETYMLDLNDESDGTRNLFRMSPRLKETLEKGSVICIDGLDASLHPALLEFLVSLFNDPERNPNEAQLIMTVHTTDLLTISIMRRDQIYFVDKDKMTGISELYSLDEFSVRKDEDIRKGYRAGRFGAVPSIV